MPTASQGLRARQILGVLPLPLCRPSPANARSCGVFDGGTGFPNEGDRGVATRVLHGGTACCMVRAC